MELCRSSHFENNDSAEKPPVSENRVGQTPHHCFCGEKTLVFLCDFPCAKIFKQGLRPTDYVFQRNPLYRYDPNSSLPAPRFTRFMRCAPKTLSPASVACPEQRRRAPGNHARSASAGALREPCRQCELRERAGAARESVERARVRGYGPFPQFQDHSSFPNPEFAEPLLQFDLVLVETHS